MTTTNYSIIAASLKKRFKDKEVLTDVNLCVPKGSIYALLGSNGAGKTTTIRILTTQIHADNGTVSIEGYDAQKQPEQIHKAISLTGQFSAVDESLTSKENLVTMGRLRQLENPEKTADMLLNYFELSNVSNRIAASYSGGMKRKLDIAMSLVGSPKVIFLDEPTTALDPQSRRNMWNIIKELNRSGVTIFLTTQYLEEAEELADLIGILDKGKIIAEGTPEQLKKYLPQGAVQFTFEDEQMLKKAENLVTEHENTSIPEEKKLIIFTQNKSDTLAQVFHTFYENNIHIHDFSAITPTLEDVFLSMVTEREEISHDN